MVESYVRDIMNSLNNKCYYSALALALALPDICGAAEYPDEPSTGKRYIEWFDKYLGEYLANDDKVPFLSGEVIFSLRNTFLHTGAPNIDSRRVKDERNQLDQFLLIVGDGSKIQSASAVFATPEAAYRTMTVDVAYLCQTICAFSLRYYRQNSDKFHFDCAVVTPESLSPTEKASHGSTNQNTIEKSLTSSAIRLLNKKLEQMGETYRYEESEEPVRSFVNQHFEKETRQKQEQIIQAILRSKTTQQVNNALMKTYSSEETGAIYKRISPLLTALPGK